MSHAKSIALSSTWAKLWRVYTLRGRFDCFKLGIRLAGRSSGLFGRDGAAGAEAEPMGRSPAR